MTRFEFYERYKLFIPITHIQQFERDVMNMAHEEVWKERMGEETREMPSISGQSIEYKRVG